MMLQTLAMLLYEVLSKKSALPPEGSVPSFSDRPSAHS
jgi:hypothetical protein